MKKFDIELTALYGPDDKRERKTHPMWEKVYLAYEADSVIKDLLTKIDELEQGAKGCVTRRLGPTDEVHAQGHRATEVEACSQSHSPTHLTIGERDMAKQQEWFKWTVEIEVHRTWVEDGFDLSSDDEVHSMIANRLPHAYSSEIRGKVIEAPDPKAIRKVQGYEK